MYRATYRLDEYRITEFENGLIWWEAHFPIAMQRRGKCFILGNILVFGRSIHEENGYMILEFHEQIKRLPAWSKTRYYCYASELMDAATGQILSEDSLQRVSSAKSADGDGLMQNMDVSAGAFRLERYQITVAADGRVSWQTHEGINRITGGQCIIESSVLFIAAQEHEAGEQNKREFLQKLAKLPKWDKTAAWCKSMVLQVCRPRQQTEQSPGGVLINAVNPLSEPVVPDTLEPKTGFDRGRVSVLSHAQKAPPLTGFPPVRDFHKYINEVFRAGKSRLSKLWQRLQEGNFRLKYPASLFVVVLLGMAIYFYLSEKKLHRSHEIKKHQHKHDH